MKCVSVCVCAFLAASQFSGERDISVETVRRATRAEACGRLAEGICSRKVCGSFVADIQLNASVRAWKARRNDFSGRKGVAAYKKRNAYSKSRCQQQAKKAKTAGVFSGSMGSPMEPKPTQAAAEHYLT